jgi:hypothetical protein
MEEELELINDNLEWLHNRMVELRIKVEAFLKDIDPLNLTPKQSRTLEKYRQELVELRQRADRDIKEFNKIAGD